jgi:hypothetical protein
MRPLTLTLAALLLVPALRAAPVPETNWADAEKAAEAAQEAARKQDWAAYARHLHPDGLRHFRGILLPTLEAARKRGQEPADLLACFEGGKDVATVLAWSPEEFFARFMKKSIGDGPAKELFGAAHTKLIGTVREGEGRAHVVVRVTTKWPTGEMSRMEVLSLSRHAGAWKLELGDPMRVLAESMKLMGSAQETVGPVQDRVAPE